MIWRSENNDHRSQNTSAGRAGKNYAVPAFNFYNLDGLFAVLEAAEEEKAPVIVELYHMYYPFLHQKVLSSAVQEALRAAKIHAYLHLDHATDQQVLTDAIQDGFQSVMVDGSLAPLEENIAFTRQIVDLAHAHGVYTEAEVGHVAKAGRQMPQERLRLWMTACGWYRRRA